MRPLRLLARALIRAYQLTFASVFGGQCRYLPSCSEYADTAIERHGLWAGGWMGLARLCRCRPLGGWGYDPVPHRLPEGADWSRPWRYGAWRQPPVCEAVSPEEQQETAKAGQAATF